MEIPGFTDEFLRKEQAQSEEDRERLSHLLQKKQLTMEEWKEVDDLLDGTWPKGR